VTNADGVKVRHLRRDPRAAIVVYENRPPYRGIEVQGEARLEATGGATRRIATRYLGERDGAAYAQSAGDDTLIRLAPGTSAPGTFPTSSRSADIVPRLTPIPPRSAHAASLRAQDLVDAVNVGEDEARELVARDPSVANGVLVLEAVGAWTPERLRRRADAQWRA
jgi:hypothetical protein